jgi:putative ABC transport system permease protein
MFFVTYLRRELRRRMRQAVFIALGLALGVGLVVMVAAASAGVSTAQSKVLSALYGVGTDVTVTGAVPAPPSPTGGSGGPRTIGGGQPVTIGPEGQPQTCTSNGKCTSLAGKTVDTVSSRYSGITASKVAQAARLHGVSAAAGGIMLQDLSITYPDNVSGGIQPTPNTFTLDGVDTGHTSLGPLSAATVTSGHSFTTADADADVAVVDSGYAKSHSLKVGSAVSIDKVKYTVIGIVSQPQQDGNPTDVYIPLRAAQDMPVATGSLKNEVNTIYLTAASAAGISAVQKEISSVREFGTLKALGWRTRRIVAQVPGESVAIGVAGAAAGIGLGLAGVAIIAAAAPKLSDTVGGSNGLQAGAPPGALTGGEQFPDGGSVSHVVSVPLHPSVTVGVIILAVVLAVGGSLLAGTLGSWRIAGLRPADALARVA